MKQIQSLRCFYQVYGAGNNNNKIEFDYLSRHIKSKTLLLSYSTRSFTNIDNPNLSKVNNNTIPSMVSKFDIEKPQVTGVNIIIQEPFKFEIN